MNDYQKALANLVAAVNDVATSDAFKGAFALAYLHGLQYDGPSFLAEWQAARDLLEADGVEWKPK